MPIPIYLTNTIPKVCGNRLDLSVQSSPRRALIRVSSSAEALSAKVGTLSLEAQSKLEKDTAKKEAKAEAKADAALKKKLASQVRPLTYGWL